MNVSDDSDFEDFSELSQTIVDETEEEEKTISDILRTLVDKVCCFFQPMNLPSEANSSKENELRGNW